MTLEEALEILNINHERWIQNCPQQEAIKKVMSVILSSVDSAKKSVELEKALDSLLEAVQRWRFACDEARKIASELEAENKMLRDATSFLSEYFHKLDGEKHNYVGTFEVFVWANDLRKARDVLEKLK